MRDRSSIIFSMNRLPLEKRAQILGLLVEGNSLRAASRLADVSINSVTKLLVDLGRACQDYHDHRVRNLKCRRVQCDEIWAFVYAKKKTMPARLRDVPGIGDVWTWVALDADSKLAVSWLVGNKDIEYANAFMDDVAGRLANRVQITTDGLRLYVDAVEGAFPAGGVDYAMLQKIYGPVPEGDERRYSPAECIGCQKRRVRGNPDADHVSTSFVERQNLTMRMHMRRFARLTNAFSKKVENHAHAVAVHFMWYNFGRIHKSLRVTPAMEAGLTDHVWSLEELAGLAN